MEITSGCVGVGLTELLPLLRRPLDRLVEARALTPHAPKEQCGCGEDGDDCSDDQRGAGVGVVGARAATAQRMTSPRGRAHQQRNSADVGAVEAARVLSVAFMTVPWSATR